MPYDKLRFVPVSATDAANAHTRKAERIKKGSGLSSLQLASQVLVAKLVLNDDQRTALGSVEYTERVFDAYGEDTGRCQQDARIVLGRYGLDKVDEPGAKWGVRWAALSSSNTAVDDPGLTRRVLYQCHCGYDHVVAKSKTRSNPFPFTGCLAHAEVTFLVSTQQILRIRGYLEHNDACQAACMTHSPAVRVHPSVYEYALKQMVAGASLADVRKENQRLVACGGYEGMLDDGKYRWVLEKGDTRALYRKFNRLKAARIEDKENEPVLPTQAQTGRLVELSNGTVSCGGRSSNDAVNLDSAKQSSQVILPVHELRSITAWVEKTTPFLCSVPYLHPTDLPAAMELSRSLEEVLRALDALIQRSGGRKRSGDETLSGHWDKKSKRG